MGVEHDGGRGEEECSQPWSRAFPLLPLIFVEHMGEVLIGLDGHQGVQIFGGELILEHQISLE